MSGVSWVRLLVLLGVAVYLTFGRAPTLPFVRGQEANWADYLLNYVVATLAVLAAIPGFVSRLSSNWWMRLVPFLILFSWMCFGVMRADLDPIRARSHLFNIAVAVFLASQVSRLELATLRRIVLGVAALFALLTLTNAGETLSLIRGGWVRGRLGVNITAGNGVVLPRIMYVFVFTCLATLVIDRRLFWKTCAVALALIPAMIAFATGGRGPLLAIGMAAVALVIALVPGKKTTLIWGLLSVCAAGYIGHSVVMKYFPQLTSRITEGDDSGRIEIWKQAINDFSLVGRGPQEGTYAHNIFLEFWQDQGVVGLLLFTMFLALSLRRLWRVYTQTRDREVLWVVGLVILQLTAQQFSLHMFFSFFWSTLVLPLGLESGETDPALDLRMQAQRLYGQDAYAMSMGSVQR